MMYKGEQEARQEACWLGRSSFSEIAAGAADGLNFADQRACFSERRMSLL
jgi:hypothetical protein